MLGLHSVHLGAQSHVWLYFGGIGLTMHYCKPSQILIVKLAENGIRRCGKCEDHLVAKRTMELLYTLSMFLGLLNAKIHWCGSTVQLQIKNTFFRVQLLNAKIHWHGSTVQLQINNTFFRVHLSQMLLNRWIKKACLKMLVNFSCYHIFKSFSWPFLPFQDIYPFLCRVCFSILTSWILGGS